MAGDKSAARTPEELITAARNRQISRRRLIALLTASGVTAGAAVTIAAVVTRQSSPAHPQEHLQKHDQHLTTQVRGDVNGHLADYADNAVVEDPLFSQPFVGTAAIAERFMAEVVSAPDRTLVVTNRTMAGGQLVVEWQASGTHVAPFLGIGGNGRRYTLNGVTIVTRRDGKIVRESHYYDAAAFRRQVEA